MISEIILAEGKYKVQFDASSGQLKALRYGEYWRNLSGDKLFYCMFAELFELRSKVQKAEDEKALIDSINQE